MLVIFTIVFAIAQIPSVNATFDTLAAIAPADGQTYTAEQLSDLPVNEAYYLDTPLSEDMHLRYNDDVVEYLAKEGYDPNYGARPLRRTIQRTVEDALSEEIIAGRVTLGDTVRLNVEDGKIVFAKEGLVKQENDLQPANLA